MTLVNVNSQRKGSVKEFFGSSPLLRSWRLHSRSQTKDRHRPGSLRLPKEIWLWRHLVCCNWQLLSYLHLWRPLQGHNIGIPEEWNSGKINLQPGQWSSMHNDQISLRKWQGSLSCWCPYQTWAKRGKGGLTPFEGPHSPLPPSPLDFEGFKSTEYAIFTPDILRQKNGSPP